MNRVATGTALAFGVLTVLIAFEPRWLFVDVDSAVSNAVDSAVRSHLTLRQVLGAVTWIGHPLVVDALVLLAAALLWRRHRGVVAVSLVVAGLVSLLVRELVKDLLNRPRPLDGFTTATGGSYPSGHAAGAAFVAGAAVVLLRRGWVAVVATVYAVVVGASRVLLNVHWLSDVIGGLLLGATFALLLPWVQTKIGERWPRVGGPALPDQVER